MGQLPRASALAAPVLLALPALLSSLDVAPLQRAEIYFLDGARSMLESGDWLVPRYRGEPFFDKPALSYWAMALGMRLFGVAPLSARLVCVCAALLTLLATYWIGRQLYGARAAACSALVLGATPAFLAFGRLAMSDMLLALFTMLAIGLGLLALAPGRPVWAWPLLGAALGLGFLTKGPIALVFVGLALGLFARVRGLPSWPRTREWAGALLLFGLLGLSWFVLVYWRLGAEPLAYFFLHENVARFLGQAYDSGRGPLYYLSAYASMGLPWSPLLPLAAFQVRREPESRALLYWLLAALVLLSVSHGKLDYYLLPLYPATALVLGRYLSRACWGPAEAACARVALAVLIAIALGGPFVLRRFPEAWQPPALERQALWLAAAVAAALLTWSAWRPRPARVLTAVAVCTAVLWAGFHASVFPAVWRQKPEARVRAQVQRLRRPGLRVVACQDPAHVERELLFHERLVVVQDCALAAAAGTPQPTVLLLHDDEARLLEELPSLRVVGRYEFLPARVWRPLVLGQDVPMRRLVLAANFE